MTGRHGHIPAIDDGEMWWDVVQAGSGVRVARTGSLSCWGDQASGNNALHWFGKMVLQQDDGSGKGTVLVLTTWRAAAPLASNEPSVWLPWNTRPFFVHLNPVSEIARPTCLYPAHFTFTLCSIVGGRQGLEEEEEEEEVVG